MKPPGPYLSVVPEPDDDDPELERYLGAARELAEPDAQSRARVACALNAALPPTAPLPAFGANTASSPPSAPAPPSAAAPSSTAALSSAARIFAPWFAIGAIVIGGLGFWLGLSAGRSAPSPSAAHSTPQLAPPPAVASSSSADVRVTPPTSPAADVADVQIPAPESGSAVAAGAATLPRAATRPAKRAAKRNSSSKQPSGSTSSRAVSRARLDAASESSPGSLDFREALERLRRARTQLEQGHATASLLLLSELDRDAGEVLFEEREATRVLALCATGETSAARATADRLAQRSPRSIYLRRLASSCIDESAAEPDVLPTESGAEVRAR